MTPCRPCKQPVSPDALACPACGAPYPAKPKWNGYGFEYKSETTLFGWPLVHVSFKYRPNRVPVVARGWVAAASGLGRPGVGEEKSPMSSPEATWVVVW